MMKKKVLVTGITGNQGGSVAKALLKEGHEVMGITRNSKSAKALELAGLGAGLYTMSFSDELALGDLMGSVDTVYAMTTPFEAGIDGEIAQGISLANAALRAGVGHFVFSSVGDADRNTGIPHFESKYEVEEHLESLGISFTIVAPSYYMDNIFLPVMLDGLKEGVLKMAIPGDRVLQQIATEDIGRFVSIVIAEGESWFGKRVNISGDEISGNEAAKVLTRIIGKPIRYEGFDPNYLREQSEDMALMYKWFNNAGYSANLGDLEPYGFISYEQWAKKQDWESIL
jgi:uncharacterized protein YbjT (DUF2867 family)